jgi:hypothetical protein
LQTVCPGWPSTTILLISASQVAGITGVSHWCLAMNVNFVKCFSCINRGDLVGFSLILNTVHYIDLFHTRNHPSIPWIFLYLISHYLLGV